MRVVRLGSSGFVELGIVGSFCNQRRFIVFLTEKDTNSVMSARGFRSSPFSLDLAMWRRLVDRLRLSIETRRGISLVTRPKVRGLRPVLGANSSG